MPAHDEFNPLDQAGVFKLDQTKPAPGASIMKLFSLKGKTAIVSGAGAGIGKLSQSH